VSLWLALPQTDDEERQADQHIEQVAAAIRGTWDDDTLFRRQVHPGRRRRPGAARRARRQKR